MISQLVRNVYCGYYLHTLIWKIKFIKFSGQLHNWKVEVMRLVFLIYQSVILWLLLFEFRFYPRPVYYATIFVQRINWRRAYCDRSVHSLLISSIQKFHCTCYSGNTEIIDIIDSFHKLDLIVSTIKLFI